MSFYLLLESGDYLLKESGDKLIIEDISEVSKNASLLNYGWPAYVIGPILSGSLDQEEQQHVLHLYSGISAVPLAQALDLPTTLDFSFSERETSINLDRSIRSPQTVRTLKRR